MSSGRLLVVEDDQEVRRSLRRALRLEGYEVVTAGDGMAGLEQLAIHPADAIILDVMMPRLDGLGTRHLRRHPPTRRPHPQSRRPAGPRGTARSS